MTDIYYNAGKVGIGTDAPVESLDINGSIHLNGTIATKNHATHTPWQLLSPQSPWSPGYWKLVTPIDPTKVNAFSIHLTVYRYGLGGPPSAPPNDPGGTPLDVFCAGYGYPGLGLIKKECRAEGSGDPVGIGAENGSVVITVGSPDYGVWYDDHATFDYVGEIPMAASDFQWLWVDNGVPPLPNHNRVVIDDVDGTVGIGTNKPVATLDVNGTARLARYSSPPFACDAPHNGTIALTSQTKLCICDGSNWLLAAKDTATQCW